MMTIRIYFSHSSLIKFGVLELPSWKMKFSVKLFMGFLVLKEQLIIYILMPFIEHK